MTIIGLTLIILGWLIQLFSVMRQEKILNPFFITVYSVGVLLLVIDGYRTGLLEIASLNLVSLLVSGLVLFGILKSSSSKD